MKTFLFWFYAVGFAAFPVLIGLAVLQAGGILAGASLMMTGGYIMGLAVGAYSSQQARHRAGGRP